MRGNLRKRYEGKKKGNVQVCLQPLAKVRLAKPILLLLFNSLLWGVSLFGTEGRGVADNPPPPQQKTLEWWRAARFGMFIHWGPVTLTGRELSWSRGAPTPIEEYDLLYKRFNPRKFDANAWAALARDAGMKYLILTSKHHDGFCLFHTKQTDYNIMHTPLGRDVVGELAAACRKQGIRFGTYYSVCDWHHPDFPFTGPGGKIQRERFDLEAYTRYLKAQVRELITQYGPLLVMWFDVPQGFDAARGQDVVKYVRSLQPDILINNRCVHPGDFQTPEQRVGAFQMSPPWESCITIGTQWSWRPQERVKSLTECLHLLIRCAGGDGNLLLNVGPNAEGEIEPEQAKRLREMGAWLRRYGHTIYGTRGGPYKPTAWLACTRRGQTIYLHLLQARERVVLPVLPCRVLSAQLVTGGAVRIQQHGERLVLRLAPVSGEQPDIIVQLNIDKEALNLPPLAVGEELQITASNTYHEMAEYGPDKAFDGQRQTRWATDDGTHTAWLAIDLGWPRIIQGVRLSEAYHRIRQFQIEIDEGGVWRPIYSGTTVGENFEAHFAPVVARRVRLNILEAIEGPTIWEFQLLP